MKVLIVDDTPGNLKLLRAVLEGENIEVRQAADGVEALALLEKEPCDAVISDILMPNMDGYRFCREVRRNERLHHLPFIIYSSTYNSPVDKKLAADMGVDKFIVKPSPVHEILSALNAVMQKTARPQFAPVTPQVELSQTKLYNETLVNKLEQKNLELSEQTAALRASEEKFRQLAENINEFCWISTADTMETLYASPAYEKIWGRTCQSLYDDPLSFLQAIPEADRPRVQAGMEDMRRGNTIDLEHRVTRPDGTVRWVHARGSGVRNEAGIIYRIVGIVDDITQRKSTEDQLRQAQKMEAIGQLAGGVAHDFNNLLMIIGANVELLMSHEKSQPETKHYLDQIAHAADRAATLTRQLLAFSRSEAMHVQVLNVNQLIATFTKLLGRVLGEDVRLVNDFAPALPMVKADAGMLEQVLMNLAVNARDAMPAGGRLIIRTEEQIIDKAWAADNPRSREGRFVCISVEDIGTGIAPENLPRIFEPFFTTKGVGKGTGLGLATVFGIAEQHQGWVDVTSQVGVGTTFRFYVPVTTEEATSSDTSVRVKPRGGGERILVAEDDVAVRAVMCEILKRQGYAVFEADSGLAAREIWMRENGNFALLLSDMVMTGGITGLELAEMLRAEKPQLKVVLTSGYSSVLVSSDVLTSKKLAFLKKPFSPLCLAETIRKNLDAQEPVNPT